MGLDFVNKKAEKLGKKNASDTLKVSRYENPQQTIQLISHICSATGDLNLYNEACPKILDAVLKKMVEERDKLEIKFDNGNFIADLWDDVRGYINGQYANTFVNKIALAGGYSAGKSSFLNSITGYEKLLPDDVNPTSLVNTFVNCNSDVQKIIVKGENLKDEIVLLNQNVLDCIRHSDSSANVAQVLKRLIIDVPSSELLDGLTFVDTPGIDNSGEKNQENDESDRQTAAQAIRNADVVFWCIAANKGTFPKSDLEFLKEFETPVVLVLTKCDLKPDYKNILSEVYETGKNKLKAPIIDAIAYTRDRPNEIFSIKGNTLEKFMQVVRNEINDTDLWCLYEEITTNRFDKEIQSSKDFLSKLESRKKELEGQIAKAYKKNNDESSSTSEWNGYLKEILLDSYDEVMRGAEKAYEAYQDAKDGWSESLDREIDVWPRKLGMFDDAPYIQGSIDSFNSLIKRDLSYNYKKREWRKDVYEYFAHVNETFDKVVDNSESLENEKSDLLKTIKREKTCIQYLEKWKNTFNTAFSDFDDYATDANEEHMENLQKLDDDEKVNVFTAIASNNINDFCIAFDKGVDLTKCNEQGFNPLTYVAQYGNLEMLQFYIDHIDKINLGLKDKNGYNVLEVSIINHNKTFIEVLKDADSSLIGQSDTPSKLAALNNFDLWLSKTI